MSSAHLIPPITPPQSTTTPKVLFIVGAGRSGSTLVDQILGQAPGFCSVGELFTVWMHGLVEGDTCGCGVPIPECPFWTAVFSDAFGGFDNANAKAVAALIDSRIRTRPIALARLSRDVRRERVSSPTARYGEVLGRLYASIARVAGARVVIDSTKVPSHAFAAAGFADVDLYVLHLVRDARAVAHAWHSNSDPGGRKERAKIAFQGMSLIGSTSQWVFRGAVIELALQPLVASRYMRIKYEDFAAAPRIVAHSILTFLGEDVDLPFLDDCTVVVGDNHIVSGNRAKFRRGPVPITSDNRWRESMSLSDRMACTALAAPLLVKYGYPIRRPG